MDGNDDVGDCTCADVDHEVKSVQVAAGNPEVNSATQDCLAAYSAITGYDPSQTQPDGSNPTDQGAEMQDVRSYWRKTGFTLGGQLHKVLLFADVTHTDTNLVKWCLNQFGTIGLGVLFPESAMRQYNAGEPWTVVNGSPIEGGHAVALVGYDSDYWYVLTWGKVQKVTPAWFDKYVEEAWTALTEDFVNSHTGKDLLGDTLYGLGQQFAALTGQPNPVPAPTPAPTPPAPTPPAPTPPAPTPAPPAPEADADHVLAQAVRPWAAKRHIGGNRKAAEAVLAWLKAKNL